MRTRTKNEELLDMRKKEIMHKEHVSMTDDPKQRGSAIVIALFVLALISVFVALAMTRTATEAAAVGNEAAEGRTLYAAQGSLEMMTRNFNKVFEIKLNPTATDLDKVRNGDVPGLATPAGEYTFVQELDRTSKSEPVVLTDKAFAGLYAIRDNWRLRTTATDSRGIQVQLTRNILNNRVPIFQFGIFYDDDLELFRPPRFSFGGRVHSNRHFFISPGSEGVYFDSRVTAAGHIITETWRNGYSGDSYEATYIKDASGVNQLLYRSQGSVRNGTPNIFASDPDLPASRLNTSWLSQSAKFDGNLQAEVPQLKLPLKVGSENSSISLIEMIKRGKQAAEGGAGGDLMSNGSTAVPVTTADNDNDILKAERFANKTGIRISLSDSKAKLPGCASGAGTAPISGPCGVRLDGRMDGSLNGQGGEPNTSATDRWERARGYRPKGMRNTPTGAVNAYQSTWVNGERLHNSGMEVWIKVETVQTDDATGNIVTKDITEDILALGMTEPAPSAIGMTAPSCVAADNGLPTSPSLNQTSATPQLPSTCADSRSVIKIQRFAIQGSQIRDFEGDASNFLSAKNGYNYVHRYSNATPFNIANGCTACTVVDYDHTGGTSNNERYAHLKHASEGTNHYAVVPFPIQLFDTREGAHYDLRSSTYYDDIRKLTRNGVMSMIDIDMANLRRFLRGDFDGLFPNDTPFAIDTGNSLRSADVPHRDGYVLYVSDRRGDYDFDGDFDMEDIYGSGKGNDGIMQKGEDVNGNGDLDAWPYGNEAERYNTNEASPDEMAVQDHKYYRRGVRLINGTVIPGHFDSATPGNTRGFTVSSENGIYVLGNYNATRVTSVPSTGNTPSQNYRPIDSATHIPAAIVADAVTILSNNWNDAKSFVSPYDEGGRLASDTTIRFAMISGDTIASKEATPNQGGISPRLNGGVHNFKRFLERWTGEYLNYSGSLINLFNSRNNNGSFKCCNTVYDPPYRNWVFDSTFLDPTRLPPGTPFFQYVQTTGFQRTNE